MEKKNQIGTLNEKPLHAALKSYLAEPGDLIEETIDGYVIDIVQNGLLVEIQTGNFSSIKRKLLDLSDNHQIKLVYPITYEKWIIKLPENGDGQLQRRKSPKRGRFVDVFNGLVSFPQLVKSKNFSLEILMIQEEEIRRYVGERLWRNRGWVVEERRLLAVIDKLEIDSPENVLNLIPSDLPDPFTTLELARSMDIPRWLAQKTAYCLNQIGLSKFIGRRGRSKLYEKVGHY